MSADDLLRQKIVKCPFLPCTAEVTLLVQRTNPANPRLVELRVPAHRFEPDSWYRPECIGSLMHYPPTQEELTHFAEELFRLAAARQGKGDPGPPRDRAIEDRPWVPWRPKAHGEDVPFPHDPWPDANTGRVGGGPGYLSGPHMEPRYFPPGDGEPTAGHQPDPDPGANPYTPDVLIEYVDPPHAGQPPVWDDED